MEGAVLRLVEEAQRFFCRASDFLGIGNLDLLRSRLDGELTCAIVDGVDAVKVTRAAVREEDGNGFCRAARNLVVDTVVAARLGEVEAEGAIRAFDVVVRFGGAARRDDNTALPARRCQIFRHVDGDAVGKRCIVQLLSRRYAYS